MKKAVIFAPFWRQAGHVGNYRIDRFVRWLAAEGFYIVLVRAGSVTGQRSEAWGEELTVRDPLGLYRDVEPDGKPVKTRKPNRLRRLLAYLLFCPDPGIQWARAAGKHPTVLEHSSGASFVLSSSPPESAHIGAAILAKNLKSELIVDMRDGWLDEPLKPLLRDSRLQRWREARLERTVLEQANKIFVTSPVWKSLLNGRLPLTQDKTVVLTNGYPPDGLFNLTQIINRSESDPIKLVHAGRFTGSRLSQKVGHLLEALFLGLESSKACGVVTLLGKLEATDVDEVALWKERFKSKGWVIEIKNAVPRDEMMMILQQADGLLLLSVSQAAIPSKLFEYLPLIKPVFTVTTQSGAVWSVGQLLEQLFLTDYRNPDGLVAESFISACEIITDNSYDVPPQFSEAALSKIFIKHVVTI
ncbi:MAG: hypothetical protein L3J70_07625 [Gammaproteobacteria bacterium]|nr:hypothetical protein [Gammaproteobacteria bacterium]